jgi:hypothetical protein
LILADVLRALHRRLRCLAALYGGDPEVFSTLARVRDRDALLMEPRQLRWHEWTRFSSRQNTLMEMGGLLGDLALSGSALHEVWPALWLGQWTHIGKGTAFGLGGYRLEAAAPASAAAPETV